MAKKSIPDHRPQAHKAEYHCPTGQEVKNIASQYNFPRDYNLQEQLELAFMLEESVKNLQLTDTTPNEQRHMLTKLRDTAKTFEEILNKLGTKERILLLDAFLAGKEVNLSELTEKITHVRWATSIALKEIEGLRAFRPKQENVWYFVSKLADIWLEGKQEQPTITYAPYKECYTGEFYHFTLECAELGNIKLSDNEPGSTIRDIIKHWRNKQN